MGWRCALVERGAVDAATMAATMDEWLQDTATRICGMHMGVEGNVVLDVAKPELGRPCNGATHKNIDMVDGDWNLFEELRLRCPRSSTTWHQYYFQGLLCVNLVLYATSLPCV